MYIVNTKTQIEYDELMKLLEAQGYKWANGRKPTKEYSWQDYREKTCIRVEGTITYGDIDWYKKEYQYRQILTVAQYKQKTQKSKTPQEHTLTRTSSDGHTFTETEIDGVSIETIKQQANLLRRWERMKW